jgi:hypothetical protein
MTVATPQAAATEIATSGSVDDATAELVAKGFELVQAFGRPHPLPNDATPLADLDISKREKFIVKPL